MFLCLAVHAQENKLEYTLVHNSFKQLVEDLLAAHLVEMDISTDEFNSFCEYGLSGSNELHRSLVEQLISVEDFLVFKAMMLKRNSELTREALNPVSYVVVADEPGLPPPPLAPPGETEVTSGPAISETEAERLMRLEAEQRCVEAELQLAVALSRHLEKRLQLIEEPALRQRVWDDLESHAAVLFPRPCHGRIPNCIGSAEACRQLLELPELQRAQVVKVHPSIGASALRSALVMAKKTVLVPPYPGADFLYLLLHHSLAPNEAALLRCGDKMESHDLPVDAFATPSGLTRCQAKVPKPFGVRWDLVGPELEEDIGALRELRSLAPERLRAHRDACHATRAEAMRDPPCARPLWSPVTEQEWLMLTDAAAQLSAQAESMSAQAEAEAAQQAALQAAQIIQQQQVLRDLVDDEDSAEQRRLDAAEQQERASSAVKVSAARRQADPNQPSEEERRARAEHLRRQREALMEKKRREREEELSRHSAWNGGTATRAAERACAGQPALPVDDAGGLLADELRGNQVQESPQANAEDAAMAMRRAGWLRLPNCFHQSY
eukprot:g21379.t2